ncbi:MAG: branched-chain amino acid transaminase [Thermodesulfobacteriota bacterium]
MAVKPYKIWFNGKLVPWNEANIHVLAHTIHYGLGVFEGIRVYECHDGKAAGFRLTDHIDRLFSSAHIGLIKIPFTKREIIDAVHQVLNENDLKEAYVRPIVFIGDGSLGVYPKENPIMVAVAAQPWGAYLGDEGMTKGIRAKVSSFTRMGVNSFMTKAKICGNYVNSVMAKVEAIELGYDEALLLDAQGYVAEGSGENIFIARNGVLKTPPLGSILEGITRNTVIDIAVDKGMSVVYERFTRDELYIADEAFLTGTAAEITPIREVDGRAIGEAKPGPIVKSLQAAFFDIVRGKNKKYKQWLDYIPS